MAVLTSMGRNGLAQLYRRLERELASEWPAPRSRVGGVLHRLGVFLVVSIAFIVPAFLVGLGVLTVCWLPRAAMHQTTAPHDWLDLFIEPLVSVVVVLGLIKGLVAAGAARPTIRKGSDEPFRPLLLIGRVGASCTTVPGDPDGAVAHVIVEDTQRPVRLDVDVRHAFDLAADGTLASRPDLRGPQTLATDRAGATRSKEGEDVVMVCTATRHGPHLVDRLSRWLTTDGPKPGPRAAAAPVSAEVEAGPLSGRPDGQRPGRHRRQEPRSPAAS